MNGYRKHRKYILVLFLLCVAYNLYFIFLLPNVKLFYLLYLDFLLLCAMLFWFGLDVFRMRRRKRKKQELLLQDYPIFREFEDGEDWDIAAHDVAVLEKQLQEQFQMNCDLQDYIAKWCHEVKIPLTAALLMADKIEEQSVKQSMQEQLEKMNLQVKSALLGAKAQSSLFDLQIRKISLLKCVKASIRNNQFFLIRKHFTLQIRTGEESGTGSAGEERCENNEGSSDISVYTDPSWLTYVLDQLISNAVKYSKENPELIIYCRKEGGNIQLCVEDNGEGIHDSDIRRIFEKGYVGSNQHNGQYKSTGMGLYMVSVILQRLGHGISVESEYGKGCRFTITFSDNREFFCQ